MANFSITDLTTAVVGIASTINFQIQSTSDYTISVTNGTISLGNYSVGVSTAVPGYLTGRRPQTGQLFPRGIYNK